ncbi:hypothetical protein [Streptomyces sp. NPDC087437]|uniref:hypothetical protein n=1 Tax=Streptomyces sp. NPDC087437 TaxID=3365789 RepID=UPI00380E1B83
MAHTEMTVGDLIDQLSACDRSAPVRQAMNPFFPIEPVRIGTAVAGDRILAPLHASPRALVRQNTRCAVWLCLPAQRIEQLTVQIRALNRRLARLMEHHSRTCWHRWGLCRSRPTPAAR